MMRPAVQRRPAAWVRRRGLLGVCVLAALGAGPAPPPPARAADPVVDVAFEDALPGGPTVDARLEEIRRRLQAALVYPPIARRIGLEGTAWLRFEIDREGAAHDVAVARSSGHAVLDRAARQTVGRAGRLPWVYGRIEVPIRFSLDPPRS
ncbi:TonB family protein [Myxococcota bacterium]|nr:TonB family protein [Myxococcota bacterium]